MIYFYNITVHNDKMHLLEGFERLARWSRGLTEMIETKDGVIFNFEFHSENTLNDFKKEVSNKFPSLF